MDARKSWTKVGQHRLQNYDNVSQHMDTSRTKDGHAKEVYRRILLAVNRHTATAVMGIVFVCRVCVFVCLFCFSGATRCKSPNSDRSDETCRTSRNGGNNAIRAASRLGQRSPRHDLLPAIPIRVVASAQLLTARVPLHSSCLDPRPVAVYPKSSSIQEQLVSALRCTLAQ